jgi:predicted deacetylase
MISVAVYSGQNKIGSWGWRHALAWRQLSALWKVPIQQFFVPNLSGNPVLASVYSLAIAPKEFKDLTPLGAYFNTAPVVVFLDRYTIKKSHEIVITERIEGWPSSDDYQHVFDVVTTSPLTLGLPGKVTIYGPLVDITPLPSEPGMQPLVSLDGLPIIGYKHPHLLIGADAWQLGNPSMPLVYPILKNWLSIVGGCELSINPPYAMIRLDDLPTTAELLLHQQPTPSLDRKREATLRYLRRFATRTGIKINLMYTSHYYAADGRLQSIGDVMGRSVREIRLGVEQNVFEVGAHGMVHLRFPWNNAIRSADPREFLDLDEMETQKHIKVCEEEIRRLFKFQPKSFVAPAWGYKTGVTKKVAGRHFDVVIDSSQHMESGTCEVFSVVGDEFPAMNCTETFRPGSRMFSYTSTDFWKCYALAGIPVHFLQHTDTNWQLLQDFLDKHSYATGLQTGSLNARLVAYMHSPNKTRFVRSICAVWLAANSIWRRPVTVKYIWKLLTSSSLYEIIDAMTVAGYQFIGLDQFADLTSDLKIKIKKN